MPRATNQLPHPASAHGPSPGHPGPQDMCTAHLGWGSQGPRVSPGKHLAPNAPRWGGRPSESRGAVRAPLHKHVTRQEDRRPMSWTGLNVFHCARRISACQRAGGCMPRTVCRGDKMPMSPGSQSETSLSVRRPQLWAAGLQKRWGR